VEATYVRLSVCPSVLLSLTEYRDLTSWTDFLKFLYERFLASTSNLAVQIFSHTDLQ
jgi:hypothetical protein